MTAPVASTAPPPSAASGSLLSKLEIDVRMLGMLAALAVIWIGFDILSGGVFLTPRNLWNLSVQTASVAIMATGMVLVIVTRNIDLSVGAILGVTGMIFGVAQVQWLPAYLGLEHWLTAPLAVLIAVTIGGLIGLFQGWLIAYLGIPSFIVTLGGLLVWRGAAWWVTTGQTIAPMEYGDREAQPEARAPNTYTRTMHTTGPSAKPTHAWMRSRSSPNASP